jgi:hypothetical protein
MSQLRVGVGAVVPVVGGVIQPSTYLDRRRGAYPPEAAAK